MRFSIRSNMAVIHLDVELFGHFAADRQRRQTMVLQEPRSAGEIAGLLHLRLEEIGLIVVDGRQCEPEDIISTDGRICFFPPMSGG
jgi:hypothetical protein